MVENILKYIAFILMCSVALVGILQLRDCGTTRDTSSLMPTQIRKPADTSFIPVEHTVYQPPSLPFSKKNSGVRIPDGLKERDIAKVINLTIDKRKLPFEEASAGHDSLIQLDVIETLEGEIFVKNEPPLRFVRVTEFEPPLVYFAMNVGAGVTARIDDRRVKFSPACACSFVRWNISGLNLQAPLLVADFNGVGMGAQIKIYHDFYAGCHYQWYFVGERRIQYEIVLML